MAPCNIIPGLSVWCSSVGKGEPRRGGAHLLFAALRRIVALACEEAFGFSHMPAVCVEGRPWRIVPWSQQSSGCYSWRGLHATLKISHPKARIRGLWLEPTGREGLFTARASYHL